MVKEPTIILMNFKAKEIHKLDVSRFSNLIQKLKIEFSCHHSTKKIKGQKYNMFYVAESVELPIK